MANKLKAKDILLLLLYLPGRTETINEPIVGRTRITKMMFLFERELYKQFKNISLESLPEFFAYNYGPFSKDLLDDLRFFKMIKFIEDQELNESLTEAEAGEYLYDIEEDYEYPTELNLYDVESPTQTQYKLTEKGMKYVNDKIIKSFDPEQIEILELFKTKINSLSLDQLLYYVYNKYPDMTTNSLIKDKYVKS